jgi:hypothetical protein
MKNFILAGICMIISTFCFSQDWTSEQEAVLEKFALDKNDHRGLILTNHDPQNEYPHFSTLSQGLEFFMNLKEKRDLITINIDDLPVSLVNSTISVYEVTKLYNELTQNSEN